MVGVRVAVADDDSYLLALSWEPGFCKQGDHAASPECKLAANMPPRLVLHGLWPNWDTNGDGKCNAADDYCIPSENDRKAIVVLDTDPDADWLKLPKVELSDATTSDLEGVMPGTVSALQRHEWWKHGTCSGLKAEDFFAIAVLLTRQVERGNLARVIAEQVGKTVARNKLLAAFETDFGPKSGRALQLDCAKSAGESALVEIRIKLQRVKVTEGLNPGSLAIPAKAPKGDCAAEIRILDWQH